MAPCQRRWNINGTYKMTSYTQCSIVNIKKGKKTALGLTKISNLTYNQLKLKKTGKEMEYQKSYQEYFCVNRYFPGSPLIQDL